MGGLSDETSEYGSYDAVGAGLFHNIQIHKNRKDWLCVTGRK